MTFRNRAVRRVRRHCTAPCTAARTACCTAVTVLVALAACSGETPKAASIPATATTTAAPSATTMVPVVTIKQLMDEVFEPAADQYWSAVGSTTDKNGTVDHSPKTDEEWAAVRNQATVLAEAANLMMLEGRAVDRGEWLTLAKAMSTTAARARDAAIAHDRTRVFDTGAELYDSCVNCHAKYMVQKYPMPDVTPAK